MVKIGNIDKKYKEIIRYLIVGVLTTIISIISYYIFRLFHIHYLISTILSWIFAVTFAYFSNKFYVFRKHEKNIFEFLNFIKYRLYSLFIEFITMYLLVDIITINDKIAKILVQIVVLILNYLFSKLFVFKNK